MIWICLIKGAPSSIDIGIGMVCHRHVSSHNEDRRILGASPFDACIYKTAVQGNWGEKINDCLNEPMPFYNYMCGME
jgi:hypothetical protein